MPEGHLSPDTLPPEDAAYLDRLCRALRCGVPGCSCANPGRFHCPSHDNAEVPTLSVTWNPDRGFSFKCTRCSWPRILDALAKRGLTPRTHLYNAGGAQEAGLLPFEFLIQQPPDWLWPDRIPLGKLTLIAGYPSSGKTAIALDVAARVSRGAPAPDRPGACFPSAPVVLAVLNGNPRSDVLPVLRLFGADLGRVYLADLLTPTLPIDYYPDDPPDDDGEEEDRDRDDEDEDDDNDEEYEYLFDNDGNERRIPRRKPVGVRLPVRDPFEPVPRTASDHAAPWPGLNKVMKRLANSIEAGSAALLVVDQVEDLAAMHRAHPATVLGMLKALAARTGAAVIALTHNPAPNYPRAVTAMQNRLAQASVVFTTAIVGPGERHSVSGVGSGERRFLVPLRPAMSDDAPAIPYVLPPPSSPVIPAQAGTSPFFSRRSPFFYRHSPFSRHSRAGGNPERALSRHSRAGGNPERALSRHSRAGGNPERALYRHSRAGGNPERALYRHSCAGRNLAPRLRHRLAQTHPPRPRRRPRRLAPQRRSEDPCRPSLPHPRPRRRPPPRRRDRTRSRPARHLQAHSSPRSGSL